MASWPHYLSTQSGSHIFDLLLQHRSSWSSTLTLITMASMYTRGCLLLLSVVEVFSHGNLIWPPSRNSRDGHLLGGQACNFPAGITDAGIRNAGGGGDDSVNHVLMWMDIEINRVLILIFSLTLCQFYVYQANRVYGSHKGARLAVRPATITLNTQMGNHCAIQQWSQHYPRKHGQWICGRQKDLRMYCSMMCSCLQLHLILWHVWSVRLTMFVPRVRLHIQKNPSVILYSTLSWPIDMDTFGCLE